MIAQLLTGAQQEQNNLLQVVKIERVVRTSSKTIVWLDDSRQLALSPYLYIHEGDILQLISHGREFTAINKVVRSSSSTDTRTVKVFPPYCKTEYVSVPPHVFEITFRGRLSPKDWNTAKLLERFHYRGKGLNRIVGRRSVLLMESKEHGIIGYGVLSATVAAAKPRFEIFETNFAQQMKSKLINQLVRIPRIVIHPEFRGIGLGALMAKHLVEYARDYWDIQGYLPIAVEVIASMTEYHKFFETVGFIRAGTTLGYARGIIPQYGHGSWKQRPNHDSYDFFKNQRSKPYLIYPLDNGVQQKLEERGFRAPLATAVSQRELKLKQSIQLADVSLKYKLENNSPPESKAVEVKDIFGINGGQMQAPILSDFSLRIDPGDVVLITGASGSGKSTLIRLLTEEWNKLRNEMDIASGSIKGHDLSNVAVLDRTCGNDRPLIDQIGGSLREGIELLNGVGLGEAHLYIKKPMQISEGQRYRFAVAVLCYSGRPIWVADEFASTLDPITAAIVAKGLRKIAWKAGATVVMAAPHIDHFVDSLLPTKIVHLRWGGVAKILSLRLRCRHVHTNLLLEVENTGDGVLTEIEVGMMDSWGRFCAFLRWESLLPREKKRGVTVQLSALATSRSIVVRSQEKVGDVIYLTYGV